MTGIRAAARNYRGGNRLRPHDGERAPGEKWTAAAELAGGDTATTTSQNGLGQKRFVEGGRKEGDWWRQGEGEEWTARDKGACRGSGELDEKGKKVEFIQEMKQNIHTRDK